jgi:hypothetical protein
LFLIRILKLIFLNDKDCAKHKNKKIMSYFN